MKLCTDLRPKLECASHNKGGVESIPFEIKVLACLRHLGRGECWDTIKELCNDIPSITTLQSFFPRFTKAMREVYQDDVIHTPRTPTEIKSVLERSQRKGTPGCLGFMDGVHVHWDRCPTMFRHMCLCKNEYPTIGWQCSVNHNRRFMSVADAQMGSVNDKTACKYDNFVQRLRNDPLYKDTTYMIYDVRGESHEEKGLWLNVDGGYLSIPELLVGDPCILEVYMDKWTSFMESERKHVECAFGILKARFRILKLPIRMFKFHEINNMFVTCCILHNMCLEFDGGDDGWNLGREVHDHFQEGVDGNFSDDENHQFYWSENLFYDMYPGIDYSSTGNLYSILGSKSHKRKFINKRDKQAHHWYHMYRTNQIQWDYK